MALVTVLDKHGPDLRLEKLDSFTRGNGPRLRLHRRGNQNQAKPQGEVFHALSFLVCKDDRYVRANLTFI
jgi:hypothetical protein